jgi:5-methyltetrahydrofolate--homocysteine methyltransferase
VAEFGISVADLIFDCVCLGVATDETAGPVTFRTMQLVREAYGANVLLGASNASHGLPRRSTLNAAYLAAAVSHGMNVVLSDLTLPNLKWSLLSADAVVGRDMFAVRYIQAHRAEEENTVQAG